MSLSNLGQYIGGITQRLGNALGQAAPGVMSAPGADQHMQALAQQQTQQDAAFSAYIAQQMGANPFAAQYTPSAPSPQWQQPGMFQPLAATGGPTVGAFMANAPDLNALADQQVYSRLGQNPSNPFAVPNAHPGDQATAQPGVRTATTVGAEATGGLSGQQIDAYIQKTRPDSPLVGHGDVIAQAAAANHVSAATMVAIMMQESELGTTGFGGQNLSGLTGGGWAGQTGTRAVTLDDGSTLNFALFGNVDDAIRATAQNLGGDLYKGLTTGQAIAKWLTGNPNGTQDANGNKTSDYLQTAQAVYQGLGQSWNPDAPLAQQAAPPAAGASQSASAALQRATALVGKVMYSQGGIRQTGNVADGVDCSSLVAYAYGLNPSTETAQTEYDQSQRLDQSQLQPGDLLFFSGTDGRDVGITHVGIYVGRDQQGNLIMVNAQDFGQPVQYANASDPYWQQHFAGAGRLAATS